MMSRSVDAKKWAAWRRRLARFERSRLSIARFCSAEGVSEGAFYLWRKKIAAAKASEETPASSSYAGKAFAPVTLLASPMLVAELRGGTRLQVPAGDARLLRVAIAAIALADA